MKDTRTFMPASFVTSQEAVVKPAKTALARVKDPVLRKELNGPVTSLAWALNALGIKRVSGKEIERRIAEAGGTADSVRAYVAKIKAEKAKPETVAYAAYKTGVTLDPNDIKGLSPEAIYAKCSGLYRPVSPTPNESSQIHDGHRFITWSTGNRGGLLHHPDCCKPQAQPEP